MFGTDFGSYLSAIVIAFLTAFIAAQFTIGLRDLFSKKNMQDGDALGFVIWTPLLWILFVSSLFSTGADFLFGVVAILVTLVMVWKSPPPYQP